jgi:hypothetical protein
VPPMSTPMAQVMTLLSVRVARRASREPDRRRSRPLYTAGVRVASLEVLTVRPASIEHFLTALNLGLGLVSF